VITAFAPASVGNIGIGFDILGLALERPGDEVVARHGSEPGLRITAITGDEGKLPYDAASNTAGVAALALLLHLGALDHPIELEVHKKMPFGSGLGSSAASAAAAVVAVDALLEAGLSRAELLRFAAEGERVATGSLHPDNVAPSLLGGIVLVLEKDPVRIEQLPVPDNLWVAVVYPHVEVLTRHARAILRPDVPRESWVRQSARVAGFVSALYRGDLELLGYCLHDEIIEPQRAELIPGFWEVKNAALRAGALGCSISGSGPSVFALCGSRQTAEIVGTAMQGAFGVESERFVGKVNTRGAYLV
jgi:homoserine kinase